MGTGPQKTLAAEEGTRARPLPQACIDHWSLEVGHLKARFHGGSTTNDTGGQRVDKTGTFPEACTDHWRVWFEGGSAAKDTDCQRVDKTKDHTPSMHRSLDTLRVRVFSWRLDR